MTQDNNGMTDEDLLDFICWKWAMRADRFYPPDDSAREVIDNTGLEDPFDLGYEHGMHVESHMSVFDLFSDLKALGFDPRERAERFVRRRKEEGDELDEVDWTWWERYDGGDDE